MLSRLLNRLLLENEQNYNIINQNFGNAEGIVNNIFTFGETLGYFFAKHLFFVTCSMNNEFQSTSSGFDT